MKNLIKYLFAESQDDAYREALGDDIVEIFEKLGDVEKLVVNKTPLKDALNSYGINVDDYALGADAEGFFITVECPVLYANLHAKCTCPENLAALAELGYVAVGMGNEAMANEVPEFKLRFIDVSTADVDSLDNDEDAMDLESIVKMSRELGDAHESPSQAEEATADAKTKTRKTKGKA